MRAGFTLLELMVVAAVLVIVTLMAFGGFRYLTAVMNKAAVIINEFGEVGLDHMLVTTPREDVVLLSSGCLCCSLRGDLVNTLASLYRERARGEIPQFDRVLVETTGLADPAPVLHTAMAHPYLVLRYRLDGAAWVRERLAP